MTAGILRYIFALGNRVQYSTPRSLNISWTFSSTKFLSLAGLLPCWALPQSWLNKLPLIICDIITREISSLRIGWILYYSLTVLHEDMGRSFAIEHVIYSLSKNLAHDESGKLVPLSSDLMLHDDETNRIARWNTQMFAVEGYIMHKNLTGVDQSPVQIRWAIRAVCLL